jgi:hypothetical protein
MPVKVQSFKCEVVKAKDLPDVRFAATLIRGGFWQDKVNLLRGDLDAVLKINGDDSSSMMQLKKQAQKAGVTLLFARHGAHIFVRAFVPTEALNSLVLLLREPRTLNELRGKNLELNLEPELQTLIGHGHALHRAGKYQLTDRGQEELADRAPAERRAKLATA